MTKAMTPKQRQLRAQAESFRRLSDLFADIARRLEEPSPDDTSNLGDATFRVHEVVSAGNFSHEEALRLWASALLIALVLQEEGRRLAVE